jgi:heat shock protein HslJ
MPRARSGPTLTVEGDRFTLETPCLATDGSWLKTGPGAVTLSPSGRTSRTCNPASAAQSRAWAQAMRGPLRYSNGPNGEMLLAGGGHWNGHRVTHSLRYRHLPTTDPLSAC